MADAISEVQKIPLLDRGVLKAELEEEPQSISAVTLQLLGTCSQHRAKERSRRCKEQHELLLQQYSFRGQKAAARHGLLVQNNSLFQEKDTCKVGSVSSIGIVGRLGMGHCGQRQRQHLCPGGQWGHSMRCGCSVSVILLL